MIAAQDIAGNSAETVFCDENAIDRDNKVSGVVGKAEFAVVAPSACAPCAARGGISATRHRR